jgi:glucosamine kinase
MKVLKEAVAPAYLLGVDGGGSGTRVRLWSPGGEVLGQGEAGPSGLGQGVGQAWRHVQLAIARAFEQAGLPTAPPAACALGLGLAGMCTPQLAADFERSAPAYALLALDTDAGTALLGAHGGQPGLIVAAGTGSVAEALYADGRRKQVGGWGFGVGDEGSGAWLGQAAMREAHRALDGRAQAGALARAVWAVAGGEREALLDWCAQAGQRDYARLAPLVFECADADGAARALLAQAATALGELAHALDAPGHLPAALMGSVARRLEPWLAHGLRERCVPPQGDAIDGALWLLRQALARRQGDPAGDAKDAHEAPA